jgi:hypothetical protein
MIPQANPVFTSTNAITTAPGSNSIYPSQPKLFSEKISYCQMGHFPSKSGISTCDDDDDNNNNNNINNNTNNNNNNNNSSRPPAKKPKIFA